VRLQHNFEGAQFQRKFLGASKNMNEANCEALGNISIISDNTKMKINLLSIKILLIVS
jgi:hypothetical protein